MFWGVLTVTDGGRALVESIVDALSIRLNFMAGTHFIYCPHAGFGVFLLTIYAFWRHVVFWGVLAVTDGGRACVESIVDGLSIRLNYMVGKSIIYKQRARISMSWLTQLEFCKTTQ